MSSTPESLSSVPTAAAESAGSAGAGSTAATVTSAAAAATPTLTAATPQQGVKLTTEQKDIVQQAGAGVGAPMTPDYQRAIEWYQSASMLARPPEQYQLGMIYDPTLPKPKS